MFCFSVRFNFIFQSQKITRENLVDCKFRTQQQHQLDLANGPTAAALTQHAHNKTRTTTTKHTLRVTRTSRSSCTTPTPTTMPTNPTGSSTSSDRLQRRSTRPSFSRLAARKPCKPAPNHRLLQTTRPPPPPTATPTPTRTTQTSHMRSTPRTRRLERAHQAALACFCPSSTCTTPQVWTTTTFLARRRQQSCVKMSTLCCPTSCSTNR